MKKIKSSNFFRLFIPWELGSCVIRRLEWGHIRRCCDGDIAWWQFLVPDGYKSARKVSRPCENNYTNQHQTCIMSYIIRSQIRSLPGCHRWRLLLYREILKKKEFQLTLLSYQYHWWIVPNYTSIKYLKFFFKATFLTGGGHITSVGDVNTGIKTVQRLFNQIKIKHYF